MKRRLLIGCFFSIVQIQLPAQPNWAEVVPAAFSRLEQEVTDSIAACRAESAQIRTKMEAIIQKKGFTREFIFGKGDKYFKEGMHKHFSSEPRQMLVAMERDNDVVQLENLHVDLYHSDKALHRWFEIHAKIKNHPDRWRFARWPALYDQTPAKERPKAKSVEACRQWVADQLVCEIATDLSGILPEKDAQKVRLTDLNFDKSWDDPGNQRTLSAVEFPLPPDAILYSFPMNGQFNFRHDESVPGAGYLGLTPYALSLVMQQNYSGNILRARWSHANGQVVYTATETSYPRTIYFNLPEKFFEPEHCYRLELILAPLNSKPTIPEQSACWDVFRGKISEVAQHYASGLGGEIKITELYFRAGKYSVREKLETFDGYVDWERGAIVYKTDEPFDPIELYGAGGVKPFVRFSVITSNFYNLEKALYSKELYYYLSVPLVEPLERLPLDQLAVAEQDNTLDAPFVRNVMLGNYERSELVLEHSMESFALRGGYVIPPSSRFAMLDTLDTDTPVPFITKTHFQRGKAVRLDTVACTLFIGQLRLLLQTTALHQMQIRHRIDERVNFFYALEQRRAQRSGQPLSVSLEQLRQQEMAQLPPAAKTLLEAKIPDVFAQKFTVWINRKFPGSEQHTAQLEIKIFDHDH